MSLAKIEWEMCSLDLEVKAILTRPALERRQKADADAAASKEGTTALKLSTKERRQRQSDQITSVIAQAIKGHRSLYGTMLRDAESAFKAIDQDGSGTVDYSEFSQAMKRLGLGLNDEQMKDLAKAIDTDGNGEIDCSEFIAALKLAGKRIAPPEVQDTIKYLRRRLASVHPSLAG